MSDPNDPYQGGAVPPPPGQGFPPPPPPPGQGFPPPPAPDQGGFPPPPAAAPGYPPQQPPPGGGYPPQQPPPGGGYMPPPPGAPPAGYQAYQPGGMPNAAGSADISTALSWSIKKFQEHLVPFLSLAGVILLVNLVLGFISAELVDSVDTSIDPDTGLLVDSSSFWSGIVGAIVLSIVAALIVAFLRVGLLRAALRATTGETPSFSDLLTGKNLGAYIITAIVAAVLTGIGLVLCVIPGLLVAFFLLFAPIHSLDKGAGVGDAISWSFNAVKTSWVACIVLVLIGLVVGIITAIAGGFAGAVVAGVLGLVLDPISALLTANLYRQMGREPIAP